MEIVLSILLTSTVVGAFVLEVFLRWHPSKKSMKSNLYPSRRLRKDLTGLILGVGKMSWEVVILIIILVQSVLWVVLWPVSLWYGNRILTKYKYPQDKVQK